MIHETAIDIAYLSGVIPGIRACATASTVIGNCPVVLGDKAAVEIAGLIFEVP